ncbi:MAG: carboxypeptidase regulatory-like domain-containing protein [Acidobacteria bacterium]|nr:carboxypeptidase regulatory-like domain-containing protein [Acidobacteriota bacterium]
MPNTVSVTGPTAAEVAISGRITSAAGVGLSRVVVILQNTQSGEMQIVRTGAGGAYRFENLTVGFDYVITPRLSRHTFTPGSKQVSLFEEITEMDFTANNTKTWRVSR